jgi:hypothetical protein
VTGGLPLDRKRGKNYEEHPFLLYVYTPDCACGTLKPYINIHQCCPKHEIVIDSIRGNEVRISLQLFGSLKRMIGIRSWPSFTICMDILLVIVFLCRGIFHLELSNPHPPRRRPIHLGFLDPLPKARRMLLRWKFFLVKRLYSSLERKHENHSLLRTDASVLFG